MLAYILTGPYGVKAEIRRACHAVNAVSWMTGTVGLALDPRPWSLAVKQREDPLID